MGATAARGSCQSSGRSGPSGPATSRRPCRGTAAARAGAWIRTGTRCARHVVIRRRSGSRTHRCPRRARRRPAGPLAAGSGLQHGRRNALVQLGDARPLERPGRDDNVTGVDRPIGHGQHESPIVRMQRGDLGVLSHRCTRARSVVLDDAQDLAPVREAVRIVAGVRVARQFERLVRELEAQRFPAFGPPAFADPPTLQHHMLPAALLQHGTHGHSGLTAPNDDGVVALSHTRIKRGSARAYPGVCSPAGCRRGRAHDRGPRGSPGGVPGTGLLPCSPNERLNGQTRDCRLGRPTEAPLRPDAWHPVHRHEIAVCELAIGGSSSTVAVATSRIGSARPAQRSVALDDEEQSGAGPGAIAIRNCASWPGIARAIACASMRQRAAPRPARRLRSRAWRDRSGL
jgi:hypothetical protein